MYALPYACIVAFGTWRSQCFHLHEHEQNMTLTKVGRKPHFISQEICYLNPLTK